MSYNSIPNQPIVFKPSAELSTDCGCGGDGFKQLVDFDDEIFFQIESTPCNESGTFGGAITVQAWEESGSTIISTAADPTGFFSQTFYPQDMYGVIRVVVEVSDIIGSLVVGVSGASTQTITAAGTHTLYFDTIHLLTNSSITLTISGNTFVGSFVFISLVGIPNGGLFLGVVDADDVNTIVARIDPTITTIDQYLTAGFSMVDVALSAGCYRLAIAEYCTNLCGQYFIANPYFNATRSGVPSWSSVLGTGTTNWVIDPNLASIELGSGESAYLESVTEVCEGVEYSLEITVDAISNARIRLSVDGTLYGSPITTAGVTTIVFTPTSSGNVSLFGSQITGTPSLIEVSKVTLRAIYTSVNYDRYSDVIAVGEYSGCDYFKLEGCNGENQFGFAFYGSSFLPSIRLEGRRYQPQYDTDADLFRYASGRWHASYVDRRKRHTYFFGRLPEYVLDFLSILVYFDNLYVNGETHFPAEADFPEIEYNDADDLGTLSIDLYRKTGIVRKTVCVGVDADCLPSILNLDEPFLLYQDENRIITQDNINLFQE
jgi:hypothetical protein